MDSAGNVYYGNYGFSPGSQALYRFSPDKISEALSTEKLLQLTDATKLTDFDANGPYDVDVDTADHVVFNLNSGDQNGSGSSKIAVWNGEIGSGLNYDVIGDGAGAVRWYTMLATTGDIRQAGGTVYVNDYFSPGIAQLTATPEPSTFILASIAGLTAAAYAYRRRVFRTK
ncbi:MAG: PEP-CTERM sorting domain-containing protein [Thermoguttaceae bacterium]